jgi:transcriptional regulator with PAS, ATPase and Fis domain
MDYNWPGNVRELENVIERVAILTHDLIIQSRHLPNSLIGVPVPKSAQLDNGSLQQKISSIESYLIRQSLEENGWNVSNTARSLGLTRQGLQKKIRKYALKRSRIDTPLTQIQ